MEAEIGRKQKELDKLVGLVAAKERKLENKKFIDRAPAAVVQKERESLAELQTQVAAAPQVLETLTASS